MLIYSTILILIIRFLPNGLLSIRIGKGGDK
jgi:branched-chain amino acid transport system permease protein